MIQQILRELDAQIEANKNQYRDIFYQLLSCGTVNPPGNEEAMARKMIGLLAGTNSEVDLQFVQPNRPNALAKLTFGQGGKTLLWNAHMDVVPAGKIENWITDPFTPVDKEGNIYARGTADDKGGLMAMIIAYLALQQVRPDIDGTILLCGVMGEETGGMGTKFWVEQGGCADAAIVGEPSKLELVVAHRGAYRPVFAFKGRTAHSSEPDLGENAVYAASRFVCKVAELNELFKNSAHPLTGSPTIAATVFHGGVKNNVIPDYAEVSIDRRLSPGETYADAEKQLLSVLEEMKQHGEIGEFELVGYLNNKGAALVDFADPIVTHMQNVLERRGFSGNCVGMRATTDMYLLQDAGIPTVIFGPGDMALAHCPNEFIPFQQILDAAKIYAELAVRFLQA